MKRALIAIIAAYVATVWMCFYYGKPDYAPAVILALTFIAPEILRRIP